MTASEILENLYHQAIRVLDEQREVKFNKIISSNVDVLIKKIDKNKSLLSALVTSLLKKIIDPAQDIRLHRTDFNGGYSARSLDTSTTTPFFKKYFPKYANKESSFLTLATREKIKWTITDGQNLKIRDKGVKKSFLEIFDAIQNNKVNPNECLIYIFIKLHLLSSHQKMVFDGTIDSTNFLDIINI
jgi:DNA (cytosine-5)-methyltransferase 1